MTSTPQRPEVVLFDLGGVIVRLSGTSWMQDFSGMTSPDEIWSRWLACPWVRRFESGGCTAEEFAAGMVQEWQLRADAATFLEAFRRLPMGLFEGADELVAQVRSICRVGCLSNTNSLHWDDEMAWGVAELFHHRFLSYELGVLKPDREIYERVVAELDVPPERVLFIDDNAVNVTGAREVGLLAEQARGVDEARLALARHGLSA